MDKLRIAGHFVELKRIVGPSGEEWFWIEFYSTSEHTDTPLQIPLSREGLINLVDLLAQAVNKYNPELLRQLLDRISRPEG